MKANELRLGNYVIEEKGQTSIITGIDDNTRVSTDNGFFPYTPIENIQPIPLTEEWLIKLGFDQFGSIKFLGDKYSRYTLGRNGMYSLDGISFIYEVNDHDLCEIKYVHQLQNLYFALTGEELTIK